MSEFVSSMEADSTQIPILPGTRMAAVAATEFEVIPVSTVPHQESATEATLGGRDHRLPDGPIGSNYSRD